MSPSQKKRKIEEHEKKDEDKTRIPFYLSTVQGIDDRFNERKVAYGLAGMSSLCNVLGFEND